MKKKIKNIVKPLLAKVGYRIQKTNGKPVLDENRKNQLLFNFYSILQRFNFNPKHIVDIGANHGSWTREALKYFPDAYYTLLEPQHWLKKSVYYRR